MTDYYENMDGNEQRKIDEKSRMVLSALKESKDDKWD